MLSRDECTYPTHECLYIKYNGFFPAMIDLQRGYAILRVDYSKYVINFMLSHAASRAFIQRLMESMPCCTTGTGTVAYCMSSSSVEYRVMCILAKSILDASAETSLTPPSSLLQLLSPVAVPSHG